MKLFFCLQVYFQLFYPGLGPSRPVPVSMSGMGRGISSISSHPVPCPALDITVAIVVRELEQEDTNQSRTLVAASWTGLCANWIKDKAWVPRSLFRVGRMLAANLHTQLHFSRDRCVPYCVPEPHFLQGDRPISHYKTYAILLMCSTGENSW